MSDCKLCSSPVDPLLDFGAQPICNRFPARTDEAEALFPLALGQCRSCGLLQLFSAPPAAELRPRVDWISYNEAEAHLDEVADTIATQLDGKTSAVVLGLSYKDATLLERLQRKGYANARVMAPADMGIAGEGAGIETIQEAFTRRAAGLVREYGRADLVVARHILEHAHDLAGFSRALQTLLHPGGLLLLEVPDASVALDTFDYSTVWEEHTVYFTPDTFSMAQSFMGLAPEYEKIFPYPLENSLVALSRMGETATPPDFPAPYLAHATAQALRYRDHFEPQKAATLAALRDHLRPGDLVTLFGAGHLACKFINFFGLAGLIPFVIDDHPRKKGLLMPGSHVPIVDSSALNNPALRLCLSSLNPESEARVRQKQTAFVQRGGAFASIFPASPSALLKASP